VPAAVGPGPAPRDGGNGGEGGGAQAAASSRNASPSRAILSSFPASSFSDGSGGGFGGGGGGGGRGAAAAVPSGPRRPGLLQFKDPALEADFAESYNRSPFVLSAERGFDLAHLSVAVVAFAAQRLGAAGLGDYGSSRAAALFTLAHVFLTLATISARAMTAEHFSGKRREALAAGQHLGVTAFTVAYSFFYKLQPVLDAASFLRIMSLTQLSTSLMLDLGVLMRVSLWWRVALVRLALLSLHDVDLCAFIAATPAGREHTAALHRALDHTAILSGVDVPSAPNVPLGPEMSTAEGARLCVQNVAFLHIVVGFVLPLAATYAFERRARLAWARRCGLPPPTMHEPWLFAPDMGGHWMAGVLLLPPMIWSLLMLL